MTQGMGRVAIESPVSLQRRYRVSGAAFDALRAWQPRAGEAVTVADAKGGLFRARVTCLEPDSAELLVFEDMKASSRGLPSSGGLPPSDAEPDITLLQALPDKERMELIIQKTTELGVSKIRPFKSLKAASLEEREEKQKKSHKWQEVARKAAKQCRRWSIPEVSDYAGFETALKFASGSALRIALWEKAGLASLKKIISDERGRLSGGVCVLSGPEGGFEDSEMEAAKAAGFIPVSLGPRILRAETAAIIAVGIIQYEFTASF